MSPQDRLGPEHTHRPDTGAVSTRDPGLCLLAFSLQRHGSRRTARRPSPRQPRTRAKTAHSVLQAAPSTHSCPKAARLSGPEHEHRRTFLGQRVRLLQAEPRQRMQWAAGSPPGRHCPLLPTADISRHCHREKVAVRSEGAFSSPPTPRSCPEQLSCDTGYSPLAPGPCLRAHSRASAVPEEDGPACPSGPWGITTHGKVESEAVADVLPLWACVLTTCLCPGNTAPPWWWAPHAS